YHRRRYLAGERAFALPVDILRGDADVGVARRFGDRVHRGERRRDDDFDVDDVLHRAAQLLHEEDGFVHRLEHLPVASDERNAHKTLAGGGGGRSWSPSLPSPPSHPPHPAYPAPALPAPPAFSASAATPGSVRPPRNSSEAPPPVEMCVIRSATPACF